MIPGITKNITAGELRPKDLVVERNSRGSIVVRIPVVTTGPCRTDPGNMHVLDGKTGKTLCYARLSSVEVAV